MLNFNIRLLKANKITITSDNGNYDLAINAVIVNDFLMAGWIEYVNTEEGVIYSVYEQNLNTYLMGSRSLNDINLNIVN